MRRNLYLSGVLYIYFGNRLISSSCETQHGDQFGPALFALGIDDAIKVGSNLGFNI